MQGSNGQPNGDDGNGTPTTRDLALDYLRAGLSVIPILPDGSKKPVFGWDEFKSRRVVETLAGRLWWGPDRGPRGIAVVAGAVSGNAECIDVDDGALFEPWWNLVESMCPGLCGKLCIVRTPRESGGCHCWYRCTATKIPGNKKLAQRPGVNDKGNPTLDTLIETRGEGGYALVPGSALECHAAGRPYEHIAGPPLTALVDITAEERAMLISAAQSFDLGHVIEHEKISAASTTKRGAANGTAAPSDGGLMPGQDYDLHGPDWATILEPHGWTVFTTSGEKTLWRRPGKNAKGISATTGLCKGASDNADLFHVFSSNAYPFENDKSYGKFRAYALLNHKGDFSAAAKELASQGFGEPSAAKPKRQPKVKTEAEITKAVASAVDLDAHLTDVGNAQRFARDHGDNVHHCHPWKRWLCWDGQRWRMDDTGETVRLAKATVSKMYDVAAAQLAEAMKETGDAQERRALMAEVSKLIEHAGKTEDCRALARMLDLARSEPLVPVLPAELDNNPWLLNCANGTINLRTGELQNHDRGDLLTKLCPTDYVQGATCPRFLVALDSIFNRDDDLIEFVKCSLGYALTGDVREQALPIWFGAGANGKTTLLKAVLDVLGTDYACNAPTELLMESRADQHPTILADLHGRRLVVAEETGQGRRLNEERIKMLTGGGSIRARRMREDLWEFSPTHKLIVVTNHKPEVRGTDHAIWRRLRLIPFAVQFLDPDAPENAGKTIPNGCKVDRQLSAALEAEHEGILAWLVNGCLTWQEKGLPTPEVVRAATADYRSEQDVVGSFLGECCQVGVDDLRCKTSDLYTRYFKWAEASGERPMSKRRLGQIFAERGFERRASSGWWYLGIGILPEEGEASDFNAKDF